MAMPQFPSLGGTVETGEMTDVESSVSPDVAILAQHRGWYFGGSNHLMSA